MINVPKDYVVPLIKILEWHTKVYMPEVMFNTRVERILEKLQKSNTLACDTYVEANEIYYIHVCVSDATNNIAECGVEKDLAWDIHNWSFSEYRKNK